MYADEFTIFVFLSKLNCFISPNLEIFAGDT